MDSQPGECSVSGGGFSFARMESLWLCFFCSLSGEYERGRGKRSRSRAAPGFEFGRANVCVHDYYILGLFMLAGLSEIAGGWLVWQWLREGRSWPWGLLGG